MESQWSTHIHPQRIAKAASDPPWPEQTDQDGAGWQQGNSSLPVFITFWHHPSAQNLSRAPAGLVQASLLSCVFARSGYPGFSTVGTSCHEHSAGLKGWMWGGGVLKTTTVHQDPLKGSMRFPLAQNQVLVPQTSTHSPGQPNSVFGHETTVPFPLHLKLLLNFSTTSSL